METMLHILLLLCFLQLLWAQRWPSDAQQADKLEKRAVSPFSVDWGNTVAICAIMRQENSEDVREWLQYHRYIGVDQVLLYDNNENGGAQAADLADFIQDGFLTYFTVPGQAMQIPVYQHCLMHTAEEYTWLAAIDIDEFLVVEDETARQRPPSQMLKAVLRDFRFYPALFMQWKGFGPGDHIERPEPGGPLEHYVHCMPLEWPPVNKDKLVEQGLPEDAGQAIEIVKYGKTVANRFWTSHASTAHGFMYWGESMPVTDAFQRVTPALSYDSSRVDHAQISFVTDMQYRNQRLVVHHYASKSYEDYKIKLDRGAGDHPHKEQLRGMGFFDALKASTFEHPSCRSALEHVGPCCRDSEGRPWPPLPTGVSSSSYTVHELQKTDVPTLDDLQINRGQLYREGHYPPFPRGDWKANSIICARWDRSTDEGALLEWLDHHKYIGVTKVRLFVADSEPKPQTEALRRYSQLFLQWRSLAEQSAEQSESQFIRHKCMEEFSGEYPYITFLHTYDYIMPRGKDKNKKKRLEKILGTREYRYGPGVVLPVFEFGRYDLSAADESGQIFPLRHYKDCTYFGHHLMTRTIANTYYIEAPAGEMDFKFVHGLLPITDSRIPWVPQLIDIPTDDERRIFPNNLEYDQSMLDSQLKRFHLTRPFGETLAVFSFPPEPSVPLPGDAWRHRLRQFITHVHSNDPSCGEALEAADACCTWEVKQAAQEAGR